jgi:signal peptidase I
MRKPSPAHKFVAGAVLLTVVAAAWFFLAPPVVGGSTSYLSTDGVSMEPRFHTGDLVLVRGRSGYHVGEIAAYRSTLLGSVVMHRIVGKENGRYIFKGDNNNFTDPDLVAQSQIVGALWLHLPGAAGHLAALRTPPVLGGIVGLGVLLLLGGAFTKRRRRRRRNRGAGDEHSRHPMPTSSRPARQVRTEARVEHPKPPQPPADIAAQRARHGGDGEDPATPAWTASWPLRLMIAGVAALAPLLLLALLAYSKPTHVSTNVTVPYTQGGAFSYSAVTVRGPAYPHGNASTGDPLYLKLVDSLDVRFAYRFHAADSHTVSGTASFSARIASATGWKRTVVLQPATHFSGDGLTLAGVLNLAALPRLMDALETSTGVPSGYTLELVPHVRVNGTVGEFPLHTTFGSPLSFTLSDLILQPPLPATSGTAAAPNANPLAPTASGTTSGQRLVPNSLQFKVASVHVTTARSIAVHGIENVICVLLGCVLALALSRRHREHAANSEVQKIQSRYKHQLVPVAQRSQLDSSQVVEMGDMAALARVAERYERMILHESWDGGDAFSVSEDGVIYQYAVYAPGEELEQPETAPHAGPPVAAAAAPPVTPAVRPPLRRVPLPEKRSA